MNTLESLDPHIKPTKSLYTKYIKPTIDFIVALVACVVLLPVMAIIALAVKCTSPGPVLFKQERLGRDEAIFKIFKFRTMCVNAEFMGDGIKAHNKQDSRITSVGRFLRKTSLDELPQLFNVLLGQMALVGPRPPVTYHPYKRGEWGPFKAHRFDVKPGMTGLAQAEIRNTGTWDDRITYDIKYVQHITFFGDISIIAKTVKTVAKFDQ